MADSDSYHKIGDQILAVEHKIPLRPWDERRYLYIFDFEFRTMTAVTDYTSSKKEASSVHPFPAVDRELLQKMHDKLVELGGAPQPLGPLAEVKRSFAVPQSLRKPDGGTKP